MDKDYYYKGQELEIQVISLMKIRKEDRFNVVRNTQIQPIIPKFCQKSKNERKFSVDFYTECKERKV